MLLFEVSVLVVPAVVPAVVVVVEPSPRRSPKVPL
jgi:hypothetical protein